MKKIIENKIFKNILILLSGSIGIQVLRFAISPVLTRIYSPEEYGLFGMYISTLSVLVPILTLSFHQAIVLENDNYELKKLINLSFKLGIINIIIFSIIIFVLYFCGLYLVDLSILLLLLIPFYLIASLINQIGDQLFIRNEQFKFLNKTFIVSSVTSETLKVTLGVIISSVGSLIISTFLELVYKNIQYMRRVGFKINAWRKKDVHISFRWTEDKYLFIKYKEFPFYRAPQILLNTLNQSLPILFLGAYFGPNVAGFYTLARNSMQTPLYTLSNTIGDVLYSNFAKMANLNDIRKLILKTFGILLITSVIPFFIFWTYSVEIFEFLFGVKWGMAGEYTKYLMLLIFTTFAYQPFIRVLPIIKAQKLQLFYTFVTICFSFILFSYAIFIDLAAIDIIKIYSIVNTILSILFIGVIYILIKSKIKKNNSL